MIDLPGKIPPDLKEQISAKYHEILAKLEGSADGEADAGRLEIEGCELGPEEFLRKVEKTCGLLRAGGKRWQSKSADLADLFIEIMEQGRFRNKAVSVRARNCTKTALAYLVLEFDVIPDFDPVMGFVDDALVLSLAAGELKDDDQELYDLIEAELK